MKIELEGWELDKGIYLIQVARDIGFDLSTGEVGVNPNSGNVYLYSEEEAVVLALPITTELTRDSVLVVYYDADSEEEHERYLGAASLADLIDWVEAVKSDIN